MTEYVNFFYKKDEYRSLSNFWTCDIVISDSDESRLYESGEHCYHGEKYRTIGKMMDDQSRSFELIKHSRTFLKPSIYTTSAFAKRNGGKKAFALSDHEIDIWMSMCVDTQLSICTHKKITYKEVQDDLEKSKSKVLIHPAMRCSLKQMETKFWEGRAIVIDGKCSIIGKNKLGSIWMSLRENAL